MAPSVPTGAATPSRGKGAAAAEEAELLRRRNAELEREVAALRAELGAARRRAETAEEAEERLCVQLGELEAEAVTQAIEYQEHVRALSERLAFADAVVRRPSGSGSGIAAGVAGKGLM